MFKNLILNFQKISNYTISINFIYYLFSLLTIIFVISYFNYNPFISSNVLKQNLYSLSVLELIIFVSIFLISVYLQKYRNNIFLKILILFCFFFFILRIPFSIIGYENTIFFVREVSSFEVKDSITKLIIHYSLLFFSIYIVDPKLEISDHKVENELINFVINVLIILVFLNLIFNLYGEISYNPGKKFLTVFFNIFNSIRICLVFTIIIFFIIKNGYKLKCIFIKVPIFYLFYILDTSLSGSRSSLFFIVLIFFLFFLNYSHMNKIKLKYLFFSTLIFILLYFSFATSTATRAYNSYKVMYKPYLIEVIATKNNISKDKALEKIEPDHKWLINFFKRNFLGHFQGISERIGFLDFYIEKYSNYEKYYKNKINLNYYYKPILDRLSPGIDLFNVPFASKIIQEEYFKKLYLENNKNEKFIPLVTNSEQITIFAETHHIFGSYTILYYFLILSLIKIILIMIRDFEPLLREITFGVILISFFDWLTCFGIDMFVVLTVYQFVVVLSIFLLTKLYFFSKKIKYSLKK